MVLVMVLVECDTAYVYNIIVEQEEYNGKFRLRREKLENEECSFCFAKEKISERKKKISASFPRDGVEPPT